MYNYAIWLKFGIWVPFVVGYARKIRFPQFSKFKGPKSPKKGQGSGVSQPPRTFPKFGLCYSIANVTRHLYSKFRQISSNSFFSKCSEEEEEEGEEEGEDEEELCHFGVLKNFIS